MVCVACGALEARPRFEVNGFDVVECTCGLARTVLPPGFDPATIYTEAYYQGGHRDGYADYVGSEGELRHEFRNVVTALRKHVTGGKLVEIGCALGYFLDEAREHFDVCGVEVSDYAREACLARGLDVVRDATPEFFTSRGPLDAAVMLDVLEHLQDPAAMLDQLHAAMRPGAHLLVTTGDYHSWLSRIMGKRWRLMTPPQHLWFFTPASIRQLFERHGFAIRVLEHPWKTVPLALVTYQAARYLGGQEWLRKFVPPGHVRLNLFDVMRVVAERTA